MTLAPGSYRDLFSGENFRSAEQTGVIHLVVDLALGHV